MTLLQLTGVRAAYDGVQALHGMDLGVTEGEMVALLGANGAGKTTTLRAISGTVAVEGAVVFDGRDVTGWPAHRVARLGVGHVPEGRGTFVDLTVEENLTLGALARGSRLRGQVKDARVVGDLVVNHRGARRRFGAPAWDLRCTGLPVWCPFLPARAVEASLPFVG